MHSPLFQITATLVLLIGATACWAILVFHLPVTVRAAGWLAMLGVALPLCFAAEFIFVSISGFARTWPRTLRVAYTMYALLVVFGLLGGPAVLIVRLIMV